MVPALSSALAALYPNYLNSLGLTDPKTGEQLTLGENDTYTPYLYTLINTSLNEYLTANFDSDAEIQTYLDELQEDGVFVTSETTQASMHSTSTSALETRTATPRR